MRTFDPVLPRDTFVRLQVEHTIRNHGYEVHVWICGELDIATHGELRAGLADIPLDDAAVVRLHLSELTFCDARGGRLLLLYGQQAIDRGLLTSIEDLSPALRRTLLLVDPDSNLVG